MFDLARKAILSCLRLGSGRMRRPYRPLSRPVLEMLETRLVPADVLPGPGVGAPVPPIANNDFLYYNVDTLTPENVFENDQVQNAGATLVLSSITIVSPPSYGILTLNPTTGILLYTPNYLLPPGLPPGQQPGALARQDQFTYTIRDSTGLTSNVATAIVAPVAPVIIGPIAPADDFALTATAKPVAIKVGANDDVRDGSAIDPASIVIRTKPEHGTVKLNLRTGIVTYTPDFGFAGWDTFDYSIKTTAGNGPGYAQVYIAVNPGKPRLQTDPLGGKMLVVDGTYNNDRIVIDRGARPNDIFVWVNGVKSGPFHPTSRIVVFGYSGNDTILVSKRVHATAYLYGGDGDDTLQAGGGRNVLLGGGGNDTLISGPSRDLLIGGAGTDRLVGSFSFDLLISGSTRFDGSLSGLNSIFLEWNSARSLQQRVLNLTGHFNNSFTTRKNGSFFLTASTVHFESSADTIFGRSRFSLSFSFFSRIFVSF